MAARRVPYTRPWLDRLRLLDKTQTPRYLPSTFERRHYATTQDKAWTPQLAQLLNALQRRDSLSISRKFIDWTNCLPLESEEFNEDVAMELQHLPQTTISEIIRALDPIVHPEVDIAHGLHITVGQTQYMDVTGLIDEYGVRYHHRRILQGMQNLVEVKGHPAEDDGLITPDMEVMLRYSGLLASRKSATHIFAETPRLAGAVGRNSRTIQEFLKAMHLLEPAYHQYDPTKVMLRARDIVRKDNYPPEMIQRMDRLRYNLNALSREPWDRDEGKIWLRKQRILRRRFETVNAFRWQYAHYRNDGIVIDEEWVCTLMLGFSRSSALNEMIEKVFTARYGLQITRPNPQTEADVTGGFVFPVGHPLRPTQRFLHAMVDSLGVMGELSLCLKLLDHMSRLHELPITHEIWSKLLNYTYINSSKPFKTFTSQLHHKQSILSAGHTREIISMMTSPPFNLTLTFEDNIIFVKTLIVDYDIEQALDVIRQHLIPHYEARVKDHQRTIIDEVLRADAAPFSPLANNQRRQRAELLLDHTWHRIQHVVSRLIKQAGSYKPLVTNPDFVDFIPDLVGEFGPFLGMRVQYRTEQGIVTLRRTMGEPGTLRGGLKVVDRQMLPFQKSAYDVKERRHKREAEILAEMESLKPELSLAERPLDLEALELEPDAETRQLSPEQESIRWDLEEDAPRWDLVEQTSTGRQEARLEEKEKEKTKKKEEEKENPWKTWAKLNAELKALPFWWPEIRKDGPVIRSPTRVPEKRQVDLTMPSKEEPDWVKAKWRKKVVRELSF